MNYEYVLYIYTVNTSAFRTMEQGRIFWGRCASAWYSEKKENYNWYLLWHALQPLRDKWWNNNDRRGISTFVGGKQIMIIQLCVVQLKKVTPQEAILLKHTRDLCNATRSQGSAVSRLATGWSHCIVNYTGASACLVDPGFIPANDFVAKHDWDFCDFLTQGLRQKAAEMFY